MLGSIAVSLMGEPQAVHCGPWFCLSSMCCPLKWPSVRRSEFTGEPANRIRFEGVGCNNALSQPGRIWDIRIPGVRNRLAPTKHVQASSAFGNENSKRAQYRSRIGRVRSRLSSVSGGSVTELSVTDSSQYGAVIMEPCSLEFRGTVQYSSHSKT